MEEYYDSSTRRRISVLLSIQGALVGAITPHLRAVLVGWDEKTIQLYFIYDGDISEEDKEESECAATEVLADFPGNDIKTEHVRCDFPQRLPKLGQIMVFQRKE